MKKVEKFDHQGYRDTLAEELNKIDDKQERKAALKHEKEGLLYPRAKEAHVKDVAENKAKKEERQREEEERQRKEDVEQNNLLIRQNEEKLRKERFEAEEAYRKELFSGKYSVEERAEKFIEQHKLNSENKPDIVKYFLLIEQAINDGIILSSGGNEAVDVDRMISKYLADSVFEYDITALRAHIDDLADQIYSNYYWSAVQYCDEAYFPMVKECEGDHESWQIATTSFECNMAKKFSVNILHGKSQKERFVAMAQRFRKQPEASE